MPKQLIYGEETRIKTKGSGNRIQVFALAEDSETPYIIIKYCDLQGDTVTEIWVSDSEAKPLINNIQKALDLLPSSK